MKAPDFYYHRPDSLATALELLTSGADTQLLAGGQSLMPMMHLRIAQPDALIDLNRIDELTAIRVGADAIDIGSMVRYAQLQSHDSIVARLPLLGKALPHIAHAAIRNRGTIGGSTALADPAAEMPALLIAMNASINLKSLRDERCIAADAFFTGLYETARRDDEIITSICIPLPAANARCGFYEVSRRHGDYAMAGVAIATDASGETQTPRVALFGVADKPLRALACEQALINDPDDLDRAIAALADLPFTADQHTGVDGKRHLAGVALKRALREMQP